MEVQQPRDIDGKCQRRIEEWNMRYRQQRRAHLLSSRGTQLPSRLSTTSDHHTSPKRRYMMWCGYSRRRHSTAEPRPSATRNTSTSPPRCTSTSPTHRPWATGHTSKRRPAPSRRRTSSTGPTMAMIATTSSRSGRRRPCCHTGRRTKTGRQRRHGVDCQTSCRMSSRS